MLEGKQRVLFTAWRYVRLMPFKPIVIYLTDPGGTEAGRRLNCMNLPASTTHSATVRQSCIPNCSIVHNLTTSGFQEEFRRPS